MQNNNKCYNKIYCSFDEKGKDCKELLKESFVDYLRDNENKSETLEKKHHRELTSRQQVFAKFRR